MQIPDAEKLDQSDPSNKTYPYPYVFVPDDAFGLKTFMMKPYPGQDLTLAERVFNYRLSRARRIIENCFGVATSHFRVFRRPIIAHVEKVKYYQSGCGLAQLFNGNKISPRYLQLLSTLHTQIMNQQLVGEWKNGEGMKT